MTDSPLAKIFNTFSKDEFKSFGKFVNSPFHNDRKDVVRFFDVLKNYYPDFNHKTFTKEKLYSRLHPGKEYNDGDFRKLSSYLLKLAEEFLSFTFYKQDDYFRRKFLAEELNARKLYEHFNKKFAGFYGEYENFKGQFDDYFLDKYYLENTRANNFIFTGNYHMVPEAISKRVTNLIYFSLITLYWNHMNILKNKNSYNLESEDYELFTVFVNNTDFKSIMNYLETKNDKYYPYIGVYYYSLMSELHYDNEEYFRKFDKLLSKIGKDLSWIDRLNLHIDLQDICFKRALTGKALYRKYIIEIYNKMLKSGMYSYYPDGYFILNLFTKMVKAGLHFKEHLWVEKFVKKYLEKLPPGNIRNTSHFAAALISFYEKDFEGSLIEISKVNYEFYSLKLEVREWQSKIYYEMNLFEQLFSHIDSYKHFVASNETISNNLKSYHNKFLNILNRLAKDKLNKTDDSAAFIKQDINSLSDGAAKDWLVSKLKELT